MPTDPRNDWERLEPLLDAALDRPAAERASFLDSADRDDEQYDRRVALKLVRSGPLDRDLSRQFLLERRILGSLEHRHIARLYDAGFTEDGTPWFAMEYVAGERIDEWCDVRRATPLDP